MTRPRGFEHRIRLMTSLAPNVAALVWFASLWSLCCLGFLQLVGCYPLENPPTQFRPAALVLTDTALWLSLLIGTCAFAMRELRWSTAVVVAGVLFLFMPGLFQVVPDRWRDGRGGLVAGGLSLSLGLLMLIWLLSTMPRT
jgi:hypothetical protein